MTSGTATTALTVTAGRVEGWFARFTAEHGALRVTADGEHVTALAADGTTAVCTVPFPPLAAGEDDPLQALAVHVLRERTVGVLLVRLGGFAAGVFEGPHLVASKVGSRPVHGRNKKGGSSQARYARRRENQATVALDAAVQAALTVLVPAVPRLDAVVTGGDRHAVRAVLADPSLQALAPLLAPAFLDVPDPRRRVLDATPALFRAVRIRVTAASS